jgi:2,3-bisphosphoglycerate-independent phosphoglycerate mutase
VPTTVAGPGIEADAVDAFSERTCASGGLAVDHASALLDIVFDHSSRVQR